METAKIFNPLLQAIPGNKLKSNIDCLTNTAWLFAYSTLWNHQIFSVKEQQEAKHFIKELIGAAKNPRKAFVNFCQRVILARQNVQSLNADFLALPSLWLDAENPEGYALTKEWLHAIKVIRYSIPHYRIEIKALGEAVLDFSEEPTSKNFNYWRNYFIENEQPILLHLFGIYCSNQQFNIK